MEISDDFIANAMREQALRQQTAELLKGQVAYAKMVGNSNRTNCSTADWLDSVLLPYEVYRAFKSWNAHKMRFQAISRGENHEVGLRG